MFQTLTAPSYIGSPIQVKKFGGMRTSNSHFSVWNLLLFPWVQVLLVSGDYPCTVRYIVSTSCVHAL